MDYLCIPHTIVYLFDVFQTFSDFVSILFIFGDINIPMFQLFIVLADCTITMSSDSDPLDAILTSPRLFYLYLHSTLISHRITLYCVPSTFVRLHITLIQLQLHSPNLAMIPKTSRTNNLRLNTNYISDPLSSRTRSCMNREACGTLHLRKCGR